MDFAVRDSFKDGYDASRFVISTTAKKQKDGMFLCTGKIVQARAKMLDDGKMDWEEEAVESEALTDNHIHGNNAVLESLFKYLVEHEFHLFGDKEDASKDNVSEV